MVMTFDCHWIESLYLGEKEYLIFVLFFVLQEKKRLAINNARRQWEVMQGNMIHKTGKLSRTPDLYANHVGSIPNSELISPDGADENIEVESINRFVFL